MGTADRMIKDRHYDSRRVRHEVDDTEHKWITFYNTIKSYRMALDDSAKFFELMDGVSSRCLSHTFLKDDVKKDCILNRNSWTMISLAAQTFPCDSLNATKEGEGVLCFAL